ncbi:uncharacterized protein LOC135476204 [Liolophura sinensis]|uniref:uncharacterized protein LOC135476204 n=1 Tax=Liolophura sinensis TaxID=3198878 RepID=UPI0031596A77
MIRYVSEERRDSMIEDVERFVLKRRLSDGHLLHDMGTFHLALVLCADHCVYDHQIYSRHFLPSKFDDHDGWLTFIPEQTSDKYLLTYVREIPKDMGDIEDELSYLNMSSDDLSENLFTAEDDYGNFVYVLLTHDPVQGHIREAHISMHSFEYILLRPTLKAEIQLDAHLASCVFHEMSCSREFRRRFLHFIRNLRCFKRCSDDVPHSEQNPEISANLDIPCLVEIHLIWPKQKLDYAWEYRIQGQVVKRTQLEENMAWLSTLGGGYASLGDYFRHHAVKAGQISLHQLAISLELGDPVSAAKCRLFFAQSLLQCGYLKSCKKIIREQYKFARKELVRDERLEAMCIALWNRLKFIHSLKKNNRLPPKQHVSAFLPLISKNS